MRTFEEIRDDINMSIPINDVIALRPLAEEMLALGTPRAEASAFTTLGLVDRITGAYPSAIEHFRKALAIFEELGDRVSVTIATGNLGVVYFNLGDCPAALELYSRALAIHQEEGDRLGEAVAVGNIGTLYHRTGDYPSALEHFRRAVGIHEELGNPGGAASVIANMGLILNSTGDSRVALEHLQRALTLHEERGNSYSAAMTMDNIGAIASKSGDYLAAMEYFRRALALQSELDDRAGIARATGNMINAKLTAGKLDEAAELLEQQATMLMDDPDCRSYREANYAELYEKTGDLDASNEHLLQALAITAEFGLRAEAAEYHKRLRDLAQKRNDFAGYIEHNNEYQRITEEVRGKEATQKMAMMEAEQKMEGERRERDKERAILYSTLPSHVADRLIRGEDVSGDHFDHASVMFLDVVGFTTNSHDLEPRVVTEILDDVFNAFDELCATHNVTKIKTIGDAYLAVAFPHDDHSTEQNIASVALGIQQLKFAWPNASPLQFRIGLHSGPVVAGVIGKQRLQYDVWGDTVNVASRMESTSLPGKIQISEPLAKAITVGSRLAVTLVHRGEIEMKGKGLMTTYWLEAQDHSSQ